MRPTPTRTNTQTGSLTQETVRTRMRINPEAIPDILGVLTRMYPNPILAATREPISNAQDAHALGGVTRPVQVSLPTAMNPEFEVRDFGPGMDTETLVGNFGEYGSSTKRETDEQTGMLGIGAKAPLAYAAVFAVETVHEGVKHIVQVGVDEDGFPYLDRLLGEDGEFTAEPSGTVVRVPVEPSDFDRFRAAVRDIAQYARPGTLEVVGETGNEFRSLFDPERDDVLALDEDVVLHLDGQRDVTLVQGSDHYRVDTWRTWGGSGDWSVVARTSIGTLTPAPSREKPVENEAYRNAMDTLKDFAAERLRLVGQEALDAAPTLFAAVRIATTLNGNYGRTFTWRGTEHTTRLTPGSGLFTITSDGSRNSITRPKPITEALVGSLLLVTEWDTQSVAKHALQRAYKASAGTGLGMVKFVRDTGSATDHALAGKVMTYEALKAIALPRATSTRSSGERRMVYVDGVGGSPEAEVKGDVLLYSPSEEAGYGFRSAVSQHLDVSVVRLNANSHARFTRENEQANVLTDQQAADMLLGVLGHPDTAGSLSSATMPEWMEALTVHPAVARLHDAVTLAKEASNPAAAVMPYGVASALRYMTSEYARTEALESSKAYVVEWEEARAEVRESLPLLSAVWNGSTYQRPSDEVLADLLEYAARKAQEETETN